MSAAPEFPRLFTEYYAIHEAIDAVVRDGAGVRPRPEDVERRLRELYPDVDMGPATLAAAIKAALANTPEAG